MEEFVVTFVDLYRGMYFLVHAIDTCLLRQILIYENSKTDVIRGTISYQFNVI